MRILLVNDDGFGEPGLVALEKILKNHDTVTVAPSRHHSGASMSLNLYSPLVLKKYDINRYSVEGTPVDCVKLALTELMKDNLPDLVISGINPGANVANNTWYSGTLAAATEAAFWKIPAIAISLEYSDTPNFELATNAIENIINEHVYKMIKPGFLLNVNVPLRKPKGFKLTTVGSFATEIPFSKCKNSNSFRYGAYEIQPVREPDGTDVHAIADGFISLSVLSSSRMLHNNSNDLRSWCLQQS